MSKITRKEFASQVRVNKYGRGRSGIFGVFYDYKCEIDRERDYFAVGYKYRMIAFNCTKAEAIRAAYDLFILKMNQGDVRIDSEYTIAENDTQRRKIPLSSDLGPNSLRTMR